MAKDIGNLIVRLAMDSANFDDGLKRLESQMTRVQSQFKSSTTGPTDFGKLRDTAKEMGATTRFTASQAADALNYLALAGYDADKACSTLPTILNLAAAGGMDLAKASDMVTDAMSALGIQADKEGKNVTCFADQLAVTAQKFNTNIKQLGGRSSPLAARPAISRAAPSSGILCSVSLRTTASRARRAAPNSVTSFSP